MFMTMNGNVKIDIAKTTDGRLNRTSVLAIPSAARIGVAGPPGRRMKRIPKAMYSAPNIGNTMSARTSVAVADLADEDVGEREAEDEVDDRREERRAGG